MVEVVTGNEVKICIDGVLVGTSQIVNGNVIVPFSEEHTSEEGWHIISVDPVSIQDPAKCEIKGTLKGRKYTDAFKRVVNISGRKNEDKKEAKIPMRLRNGWK